MSDDDEFSEEEIEVLEAIGDLEDKLQMALGEDVMTCDDCKMACCECDCDEGPCPDCRAMHQGDPMPADVEVVDAAKVMPELLVSLAWLPHSAYHAGNVKRILAELCPGVDLSAALKEYERICLAPPQPGSPKLPMPRDSSHMVPMIEADFASLEARALAAGMLRRFRETPITIEPSKRGIPNVFPMEVMEEVGRFTPLEEPVNAPGVDSEVIFDEGTPFELSMRDVMGTDVHEHLKKVFGSPSVDLEPIQVTEEHFFGENVTPSAVKQAYTRRSYPGHPAGSRCSYWSIGSKTCVEFDDGDKVELPNYSPTQLAEEILQPTRRVQGTFDVTVEENGRMRRIYGAIDPCQRVFTKDDKEHE